MLARLKSGVGATLTIDDGLSNTNSIITNGGTIVLDGAVTGNGSSTIQGGTLEIGSTDAEAVSFNGSGTLQIDGGASLSGAVNGFAPGDTIDAKFAGSSGSDQFQISTVYDGSTDTTLMVTDLRRTAIRRRPSRWQAIIRSPLWLRKISPGRQSMTAALA